MLERSEKALRLLCLALGAAVLLQVVLKIVAHDPLAGLKIPALPALSVEAEAASGGKATNNVPEKAAGVQAGKKGTNSVSGTNSALAKDEGGNGTNMVSGHAGSKDTNAVSSRTKPKTGTNEVAQAELAKEATNSPAPPLVTKTGTNVVSESGPAKSGSNAVARGESGKADTNSVSSHKSTGKGTNEMAMKGPNMPGRPGQMVKRAPDLPLPIQARVDRVVDSELFGQVFHPMPTGLLGIAGNMAFLRAPNGQTGAVKEGDALGTIKLLSIGVNRVLVEEDGQKKELMIFEGLGGQSLLPK